MQGQPEFSSETAVIDTLRCNEFTAQLLDSTGAPKHLYGIKEKDHFVEAYVEAKEGEQVSAKLDSWDRSHIYKVLLRVGIQRFGSFLCEPSSWPRSLKYRSISKSEAQSLKFSKAAVTDDEKHSIRRPEKIARLGRLSIGLRQVRSLEIVKETFPEPAVGPWKAIFRGAETVDAIQFSSGPTIPKHSRGYGASCSFEETFTPIYFQFNCVTRAELQRLGHVLSDHAKDRLMEEGEDQDQEAQEENVSTPKHAKKRPREEDGSHARKKRLQDLQKELEELQEMERHEDLVLEKRRRLTGGSNSLRNANASTQAGESSISVKKEPTESGAGSAGTADEPLIIADLSD
ncbi:hypothetical protein A4X06_0g5098 [Tilletia controversa]|uniref:Uncharacterized protein n=1 Tax=Tilletia controversa TaxID=13291 RepID=A0A8X7MS34_9BASI|nr:hypothetical protein CF328_g4562 [Tilletia controversa]KAE8246226.1 hypothetical protein A4X06_0g5098 [Tilletia controversa]